LEEFTGQPWQKTEGKPETLIVGKISIAANNPKPEDKPDEIASKHSFIQLPEPDPKPERERDV
jgi:hypothetical protein